MFIHISHAVIPALLIGIITSDASQCGNCFYGQEERDSGSRRDSEREREADSSRYGVCTCMSHVGQLPVRFAV